MTPPTLDLENDFWRRGLLRIAGVDEVGIGCLAGPVVAAAVILPPDAGPLPFVRDSKTLSAKKREHLAGEIRNQAVAWAIGSASVSEIESLNVLHASHLAMARALEAIGPVDHCFIDGRPVPGGRVGPHTALVGGDGLCYSISCASILAKVHRDTLMLELATEFPGYGWEKNAGYGTRAHLDALQTLGVTPHHRKTYEPVIKILAQGSLF